MHRLFSAVTLGLALTACGGEEPAADNTADNTPAAPTLKTDKGVDADKKVLKIGALNDESGPAAVIGKPFATGKRVLAAQVNAGGSGLLPAGWTIGLVERDHGYNPQSAVQAYNEIAGEVLFVGTSFGTPNTLPLRPMLERDNLVAYPASLSSQMAEHENTPPLGPSYEVEARRALDWIVAENGTDSVKLGIVYQQDDYGQDGLDGWKAQAELQGLTVASEQAIAPGQKDFTAVVTGLKEAGATHVLLTTLPSATGPIVGTAAQLGFGPTWIGNTPSWIDAFFNPEVIPSAVFGNFYWVQALPFWGEDVPGMTAFTQAFDEHKGDANADFYVLLSYVQGITQLEAARQAIDAGDVTRAGYLNALHGLTDFDAGGFLQPLNLSEVPYTAGTQTRILKPDFENSTWTVVADYAAPKTETGHTRAEEQMTDIKAKRAGTKAAKTEAGNASPAANRAGRK